MNLTEKFPRSPKEQMAGLVHIPRMTDKARAARDNTLGDYIYPCPLDKIMLEFLDVDSETFQHRACGDTEETLAAWVAGRCRHRSQEEKIAVNGALLNGQPDNPEKWEYFYETRDRLNPSRKDITTWVDLIDLEEGRT
jgi:hypothetical protein